MRVLLAGATGVIGRPLVPLLRAAGHDVVGLTRRPDRLPALAAVGAQGRVVDALDPAAVDAVVADVRPDAVIDQLTALPERYDPRRLDDFYGATNRLRRDGTAALLAAAEAHGARRYVLQSISFLTAPEGPDVLDEDARPWTDAPAAPAAEMVRILVDNEARVTGSARLAGLALRYGFLYGPGTYLASDGSMADEVRSRRMPLVGGGGGRWSLVHAFDAARATVAALERGAPGVYNVVDDDPAPMREWLPAFAAALGAKPPRRVPAWLARLLVGELPVRQATAARGASNARARAELDWAPAIPSWRTGLVEHRDGDPVGPAPRPAGAASPEAG
jgi:nucleoside-diphosphate-sugar epimerase